MARTKLFQNCFFIVFVFHCKLFMPTNCFKLEECEFLDLTHPLNERTINWPNSPGFKLETLMKGITPRGHYYEANKFSMGEHIGTHMDAPSHFAEGMLSVHQINPSSLIGEACVVDLSAKADMNADYLATVKDLTDWEANNDQIDTACILVFRFGWSKYWPDKINYLGTDGNDTAKLHFPGISAEAAQWLVERRSFKAVGVDTASVDNGPSKDFKAHRTFSLVGKPLIENLRNLQKVPTRGSTLLATAIPIEHGSGAPARVLVIGWNGEDDICRRVDENETTNGVRATNCSMFGTLILVIIGLFGKSS